MTSNLSRGALYLVAALLVLITVGALALTFFDKQVPAFISDRYDAMITLVAGLLARSPRDDEPTPVTVTNAPNEPVPVNDEPARPLRAPRRKAR